MGRIKAKTHLQKLGFRDMDKKTPEHDKIQTWVYDNIVTVANQTILKNDLDKPWKYSRVYWEFEIVEKKGYGSKFIVGFVDLFVKFKYVTPHHKEVEKWLFIEVKSKIPSLGELIRQMRAYQVYLPRGISEFLIVSPDDSHIKILNEQGFHFYKYKDPSLLF